MSDVVTYAGKLKDENTRLRDENEMLRVLLHDAVWTTTHKKDPHWLSDALATLKGEIK
jgi:hypothetical protein